MTRKHMCRIITGIALGTIIVCMAACNTTKGVGTDIEKAGEGLKNSAERNGAN